MLMVTPTGSTNDDTSSETPRCFWVRSIVKGRVAALELVEKASICTGKIALKNCPNFFLLKIIDFIMDFAPIGVFALMAALIVDYAGDLGIISALGMYALTVVLALAVIIVLVYPTLLRIFSKKKLLFRNWCNPASGPCTHTFREG